MRPWDSGHQKELSCGTDSQDRMDQSVIVTGFSLTKR